MWKKLLILVLVCFAATGKKTKKRVCIVGAGLSGLVAAKYFGEYPDEFEPVVFEKNSDTGGLWIYTDSTTVDEHGLPVHSSMYKNLRANSVTNVLELPGYPWLGDEESNGRFVKHEIVLEYLRNYTEHFNIRRYIQFNTNVEKIKPLPHLKWLTVTRNLNNNEINRTTCDAVVICNGHLFKENVPKINGIESFTGKVLHSHIYRKPEMFSKQTVVILGGSVSGIDIGVDLSSHATKIYLSHRHDKISGQFPSNLEQVPGVVGVEGGKLVLSNGTNISADALILCTGYVFDFPFLDDSSGIVVESKQFISSIYKHMINIDYPTMAIIDLLYRGFQFQVPPVQVNYFRAVLRGELSLPSREQMWLEAEIAANASSRKGHVMSYDEYYKYHNDLVLQAHGKPFPWWIFPYKKKSQELSSTDRVHYKDKKFVIDEAHRTVDFI